MDRAASFVARWRLTLVALALAAALSAAWVGGGSADGKSAGTPPAATTPHR